MDSLHPDLLEPWKRSSHIAVTSMSGFGKPIPPEFTEPSSKESILANYKDGKDIGIRHVIFTDPSNTRESTTGDS